ncbi:3-isopropylmalate dehydratase small subunit [Scytonema sp. NUACC21]
METTLPKIIEISGTSIVLSQNNIDTDRIIPARFLKSLSFDNLGMNVFHDDRKYFESVKGETHPFDNPERKNAKILVVAQNFGCGSSREHAPQALLRWGIGAIVGESFGEIFFWNCSTIGLPCVTIDASLAQAVRDLANDNPGLLLSINLKKKTLQAAGNCWDIEINETARQSFVSGCWSTLATLESANELILAKSRRLPYLNGWKM